MKILLAEDDRISCHMMQAMLTEWGYDVVIARNGHQAWEILCGEQAPQLAILDWVMPEMDGVEVCRNVRQAENERYTYVVLLTAKGDKEDLILGLDAGADDYIIKPFDPQELKVRLRAGRRILNLQEQLLAARAILMERATHDPLTGLWNRSAIGDLFVHELFRVQREKSILAVAMADIDHFKAVNDSYSHMAGDTVLQAIAERITTTVRNYDRIARYGGDEFLLVMPGCDLALGAVFAERVRAAVTAAPINTPEGLIPVTMSIGVTACTPDDPSFDALIARADAALYQAKRAGRNRVEVCAPCSVAP